MGLRKVGRVTCLVRVDDGGDDEAEAELLRRVAFVLDELRHAVRYVSDARYEIVVDYVGDELEVGALPAPRR